MATLVASLPSDDESECMEGSCAAYDSAATISLIIKEVKKMKRLTRQQIRGTCAKEVIGKKVKSQRKFIKKQSKEAINAAKSYPEAPVVCN